jgi:ribose/xylose/arabinose/galactoside ABC-type transport system permease subunit
LNEKGNRDFGFIAGAVRAVTTILNRAFISPVNLINTANLVGIYGIFSIGLGLVIITGGIDLSVGSMFALCGVLLAMALSEWHWRGRWQFCWSSPSRCFWAGCMGCSSRV